MQVEIRIWRENGHVLVRNDKLHINTFGDTLEEALENFHEAYLVATDRPLKPKNARPNVQFVFSYPLSKQAQKVAIPA
jgi:hypothetical protein